MPPGYGPPGMPPFQPVAMPTGQPMGYPGSMPGIPASYPPQLTQQNVTLPATGAFQPIPNTGSPVMMSKELSFVEYNLNLYCLLFFSPLKFCSQRVLIVF